MDGAKPDAPLTLYVGTCGYGIWKATDGGSTWRHVSTGRNGRRRGWRRHDAMDYAFEHRHWDLGALPLVRLAPERWNALESLQCAGIQQWAAENEL